LTPSQVRQSDAIEQVDGELVLQCSTKLKVLSF